MKRRDFLQTGIAAGVTALAAGACARPQASSAAQAAAGSAAQAQGALKQSVTRWPFGGMSVDELARGAKEIGLLSVELLEPEEWPIVQRHGLTCAMGYAPVPNPGNRLSEGWNELENHAWLIPAYQRAIPMAAQANIPSLICFSGNRDGLSDQQGLENCAVGLRQIMPDAERHGVTICMELLNSKVDHPGYMCDHTAWGVALAQRVGSERFKLLYDIYHLQTMEGDVIRTIQNNHQYIAHYHTAGVPGRHEIDETQELYYPAIMRAIKETGFQGYIGQEFIPTRDPLASLAEAVRICNV
ncbi:MAG TPA: TIM barrel protein [Longimicrobiaceae bacterium]|nr:TIM barrel protein [Longimicrobiaceae bacterium]